MGRYRGSGEKVCRRIIVCCSSAESGLLKGREKAASDEYEIRHEEYQC